MQTDTITLAIDHQRNTADILRQSMRTKNALTSRRINSLQHFIQFGRMQINNHTIRRRFAVLESDQCTTRMWAGIWESRHQHVGHVLATERRLKHLFVKLYRSLKVANRNLEPIDNTVHRTSPCVS